MDSKKINNNHSFNRNKKYNNNVKNINNKKYNYPKNSDFIFHNTYFELYFFEYNIKRINLDSEFKFKFCKHKKRYYITMIKESKDVYRFDVNKKQNIIKKLKKLLKLASILSKGFLYARVDFYIVKEKIFFGEITFTSSSGTEKILPHSFDKRLCSLIKLPKLAYNIDIGEYYILKNPLKTKFNLLLPNYFIIILLFFKLFYTTYQS